MSELETTVLVFARAPEAGRTKTRLIPLLGADGAARISAQLTQRALRVAVDAAIGPVELWCAPDCSHDFFERCRDRYGVSLHAQSGGDIGARMAQAFDDVLRRHARAVLIGADAVSLQPADLRAADVALRSRDAVFAPAEDGGYLLVGLRVRQAAVFEGIAWGSAGVWSQTLAVIDRLGLHAQTLATGYDLDRPDDYRRAVAEGLLVPELC
ncbi:TIGR04282 family arsenosugar biosynthesis glycosyltransferase [Methyloversatilis sp.]|uniref:TIGR04282 family arsenosugar biosynthesis glycosyltransferase n=1 Tax=Methyloversatilis sp. TaxID=2569862 RepID=UPI002734F765|nr:TIGR04282 family arsenosugar biosynthesis glycosyltransferase [Methyloversatilis sp.]MDP2869386.1 TIGR04282 family arsenosugar biosynthesis glycosyltransferase [Methyloversatilis sp.]MDP3287123.1 TIGR04282 family arsenosugar biosynthesis glycosyltransferase [Methyloversatilis sp.]MDP3455176.1 TIGR04282 family arsenosugar biosynthesis glycosyltransferase [Methyloversatilis sp.]MDP3579575.1 TIGR04282 family arsenosugar biosynthesis glycosyltransferase [Methyloversatilis sp.]